MNESTSTPTLPAFDAERLARWALTIGLALYGYAIARHMENGSFVDAIDLPIHETGHLVFAPFGEFMQFAGGTLFQLIVPAVFMGYFLRRRDPHAASITLWWIAQNCWNIAVYAGDAQAQELPLVGGGEHDWLYLLSQFGWLACDQRVSHAIWKAGVVIYLAAIAMGCLALTGAKRQSALEFGETSAP